MLTVVNFSHPIEENRQDVIDILGKEYQVIPIPVQVDMEKPMVAQVEAIYQETIEKVNGNIKNIDTILLPGLAIVAVLLIARFKQDGYCPHVLLLSRRGTLPRFEATELIKSFYL